jgi:cell division protein ZapA (FtsZ GTPase activity inhibitor)
MPDLNVTIFNQNLKLSYQENEKDRLINAIEILNKSWNKFSNLHGKVSDLKIITLISLELQDSIGDYKDKLNLNQENVCLLKKKIEEKNREFENSLETINKLKLDIEDKNKEISKIECILDEIHHELLKIKTNILANKNE